MDASTNLAKSDNVLEDSAKGEMEITSDAEKSNEIVLESQSPWFIIPVETAKFATIVGVILFSSIARLASSGTVIILQKDWIVVISENDTDYLASMLTLHKSLNSLNLILRNSLMFSKNLIHIIFY